MKSQYTGGAYEKGSDQLWTLFLKKNLKKFELFSLYTPLFAAVVIIISCRLTSRTVCCLWLLVDIQRVDRKGNWKWDPADCIFGLLGDDQLGEIEKMMRRRKQKVSCGKIWKGKNKKREKKVIYKKKIKNCFLKSFHRQYFLLRSLNRRSQRLRIAVPEF